MPYVNKEPRKAIALRLKEAREKGGYFSPEDFWCASGEYVCMTRF